MSWRDAPKVKPQRRPESPRSASKGQSEPLQWWDVRVPPGSDLEARLARSQNGPRRIWDREVVVRHEPKGHSD